MKSIMSEFGYLLGKPTVTALLRSKMSDFKVFELLPYELCGSGEHVYLHIRKTGANTNYVARELAKYFKVKENLVTYAGLKDRFAVTEQYFSVHLPGKKTITLEQLNDLAIDGVEVLSVTRHNKKLRIGGLTGNRFELILRDVSHIKALIERWQHIITVGVPNYFGEQRFGINAGNLPKALELFSGKKVKDQKKRGMYLSAARSYIFNKIITKRINENCFNHLLAGDACMLKNTQSVFKCNEISEELIERLNSHDIDITAPLWGAGVLMTELDAAQLEQDVADNYPEFCSGLVEFGLKQERRKIRITPENADVEIDNTSVKLSFTLPAGSYATTVLRELVDYKDMTERKVMDDSQKSANTAATEQISSTTAQPLEKEKTSTVNTNTNKGKQPNNKLRILLSNDDGVSAQGIKVLYEELSKFAEVMVVAPDRNCSGASNSLTLLNPLRAQTLDNGFISVNGTPTDCVQLGISHLMQPVPDLVVAGINNGENLGDDVLYSGTVAAATEGRHMGMPAIAVSLASKHEKHYKTAAKVTANFIKHLHDHPIANDQIININVPDVELEQLQGYQVTRLGHRHKADTMKKTQDPWHRDIYWYGSLGKELDAGEGTDFNAVANHYVSITPITVDMTAYNSIKNMTKWIGELSIAENL